MKKNVNFSQLWERLRYEAENCGNERFKAVLMNHDKKREYICRKLGIISDTDITRMTDKIRAKGKNLNSEN